jgi:hypothetical protein
MSGGPPPCCAKNHTSLMAKNLMAGGHDHIGSWLPDLSLPARRFLVIYDICAIEELFVRREPCVGTIPPGWRTKATDRANWSPLPWLNSPHLCAGGPEIHLAITDLLSQRGGIGGTAGLRGIQQTIPTAREQMYQLSASQYFRVAGILPDGSISGRHFSPVPCRRVKNPRAVHLQLDPDRPSEAQGSGFSSSVPCSVLQAPSSRRVITSKNKGYWRVELTLDQRAIETPVTLPAHSVVPPLPPCLRPVVDYLERHHLTPTHMSSDASFEFAGDKPSSLFSQNSLSVRNATGCVMVADNSFLPKQSPPLLVVLLTGIERIMNVNFFPGRAYLRHPHVPPPWALHREPDSWGHGLRLCTGLAGSADPSLFGKGHDTASSLWEGPPVSPPSQGNSPPVLP